MLQEHHEILGCILEGVVKTHSTSVTWVEENNPYHLEVALKRGGLVISPALFFASADTKTLPPFRILQLENSLAVGSTSPNLIDATADALNAFSRYLEVASQADGNYEKEVTEVLMGSIRPGWICADVGSHIGFHTLTMGRLVGDEGKVYAFDACPANINDLVLNARTFGVANNIIADAKAITDGTLETVTLYEGRNRWSTEWNLRGRDVAGNQTSAYLHVPATSLDKLFPANTVHLVKIDVEGAANGVVRGMRETIKRCHPVIIFEFHGEDEREAVHELRSFGYEFWNIEGEKHLAPDEFTYHMIAASPLSP